VAEVYDVRTAVADALGLTGTATDSAELTIEMNGEATNLLNTLTEQLDRDRGTVIAEALSFLFVGVTAQKEGMQVAIIEPGGKVQTVIDLLSRIEAS
jgi:hypothetical protein